MRLATNHTDELPIDRKVASEALLLLATSGTLPSASPLYRDCFGDHGEVELYLDKPCKITEANTRHIATVLEETYYSVFVGWKPLGPAVGLLRAAHSAGVLARNELSKQIAELSLASAFTFTQPAACDLALFKATEDTSVNSRWSNQLALAASRALENGTHPKIPKNERMRIFEQLILIGIEAINAQPQLELPGLSAVSGPAACYGDWRLNSTASYRRTCQNLKAA